MKSLVLLVGLVSALSFAAEKKIRCTFDEGYRLQGTVLSNGSLNVTKIVGGLHKEDVKTADDINNNPVKAQKATDGGLNVRYAIDALSGDPDYGDLYDLFIPAKLKSGSKVEAQLTYQYISRDEVAHEDNVDGSCRIE